MLYYIITRMKFKVIDFLDIENLKKSVSCLFSGTKDASPALEVLHWEFMLLGMVIIEKKHALLLI